ncbi:carbon-nitrogen hydrolase family protein [Paludibacterium sp.]|uniref:carbon-nitrogen hydrolase family protein n=1 Tax=Paludibacterium sp. TaxID=1917523 RepID=UPI0025E5D641|nr:carbon-nitrogen hydrolase family protein [Paludibacterium sp.]MBV8646607.1 carbon-nitrogen hydrolase family protein [Paludibacterium sp.]
MRIELAQLPCEDGHPEANLAVALAAIDRARPDSDLIVFPETFLSGFPTPQNVASIAEPLDGAAVSRLAAAARDKRLSIAIGLAEARDGRFFNTTVLLTPEGLALSYRKAHLWASDQGVFSAGDRIECCEWRGLQVGALICYDIEFPESARALATLGAEVLLVTDGNMDPYGPVHRRAIVARAMENQMYAVLVNRCGGGDGHQFPGESVVVDPFGEIVAECGARPEQRVVELDLSVLARARAAYDYRSERRIGLAGSVHQAEGGRRWFAIDGQSD